MTVALTNGRVLTPDGWRSDLAVIVEGSRIARVTPETPDGEQHDLEGRYLLPGFIDCQVNGGGGVLFNDSMDVDGIRAIARAHRQFGTAALLPTLISDTDEAMQQAVSAIGEALAAKTPGVLGIHLEGPFLATARKGVHNPAQFRVPDASDVALVCALKQGRTLLTLAPECVPADVIQTIADAGVIVSAGHTAADHAAARQGLDHGVRGFTHLFNAMSPLTSRAPGVVGAALDDRDSWCGIIVDGHHVHPATLRVALAAKPRGKVFLVTDAMPPVGADDPSFVLNGETITARNGMCQTAQGVLAGSALTMIDAVRNAIEMLGVPLDEAARMASTYPADFLGLSATHGRIAAGFQANFTIIDDRHAVHETWVDGDCKYRRP